MLVDVAAFVLFFASWVLVFSFLHRLLGNEVDEGDKLYTHVTEFFRFFIHTWIFSTGGGKTNKPDYKIWFDKIGKKEAVAASETLAQDATDRYDLATVMIYGTWLAHMINQILVNKILLSFLIAMVGKTLNKQKASELINSYEARAALNASCSSVMDFFGMLNESELIVLSANYKKPEVVNETTQIQKKLSVMDKDMKKIQDDIQNHIAKQDEIADNHKKDMA